MEAQKLTGETLPADNLEQIEAYWRRLAAAHHAAGIVLRSNPNNRALAKAYETRAATYEASDKLLDAHHAISINQYNEAAA